MNKKDLVLIRIKDEIYYFTSTYKAGKALGIKSWCRIDWMMNHNNTIKLDDGTEFTAEIIDGHDVPYGLINNEIDR
jgi:hypothetical protein